MKPDVMGVLTFGQYMRMTREATCLNQSVVARAAGITPAYLNDLEFDRRKPPPASRPAVGRHRLVPRTYLTF